MNSGPFSYKYLRALTLMALGQNKLRSKFGLAEGLLRALSGIIMFRTGNGNPCRQDLNPFVHLVI